jgi:hypothetical protein
MLPEAVPGRSTPLRIDALVYEEHGAIQDLGTVGNVFWR